MLTKDLSAKVTARAGSERTDDMLTPAGDNKLEAEVNFKLAPGIVAITSVKHPGKPEQSVRFTIK